MTNVMQALIAQADTNRRVIDGRPYFCSGASVEHDVGKITCHRDYTTAGNNIKGRHTRTSWMLNGKRIAGAKLEELTK